MLSFETDQIVKVGSVMVIEANAYRGRGVCINCTQGSITTSFEVNDDQLEYVEAIVSLKSRKNIDLTFDNVTTYEFELSFDPEGISIGNAINDQQLSEHFVNKLKLMK
jgi:hypothetical protein